VKLTFSKLVRCSDKISRSRASVLALGDATTAVVIVVGCCCCFAASHLLSTLYGSGVSWQGPTPSP
jgi:hypothetical protein